MINYYNILGIEKSASIDTIKAAYWRYRLSKRTYSHAGQVFTSDNKNLVDIQTAFEVLSDLQRRQIYDKDLERATTQPHPSSGPNTNSASTSTSSTQTQSATASQNVMNSSSPVPTRQSLFAVIANTIMVERQFYLGFLAKKRPPYFYLIMWLGGTVILIDQVAEEEWFRDIGSWPIVWAVTLPIGFITGFVGFTVRGWIQSVFTRLSGGSRNTEAAINLNLYSGIPYYLILLFCYLFNWAFYGDSYFTSATNSNLDISLGVVVITVLIATCIINYKGIRLIHNSKPFPTALFFVAIPILFNGFILTSAYLSNEQNNELATQHNNDGLVYYDQGEYDKALESFESSLIYYDKEDEDALVNIYENIGYTYEQMTQPEEAIQNYRRALPLTQENSAERFFLYGRIALNENDYEKAINFLNKANESDPVHERTLNTMGLLYLGELKEEYQNYSKALSYNYQYHTNYPSYLSKRTLATNYYLLERYSDSFSLFSELATEYPDDAYSKLFLGWIYYLQNDLGTAKIYLRDAIALEPSYDDEDIQKILSE